jgi:hypothetical protein
MIQPWRHLAIAAACGALLVGTTLPAQASSNKGPQQSTGALDYIEPAAHTLHVTVEDQDQPIAYDTTTTFHLHDQQIDLTRLQRGDKLQIDWTARDGKKVAVRVEILERQPGAPAS